MSICEDSLCGIHYTSLVYIINLSISSTEYDNDAFNFPSSVLRDELRK